MARLRLTPAQQRSYAARRAWETNRAQKLVDSAKGGAATLAKHGKSRYFLMACGRWNKRDRRVMRAFTMALSSFWHRQEVPQ